jgi:hypothetical protein
MTIFASGAAAAQREPVGIFFSWGAFREPGRCFAISEAYGARGTAETRPSASVGYWPARGVRSQVHFKLSREKRPGSAVLLKIDDDSFQLLGGPNDAWAPDRRADAAIVAAMRTGLEMSVETRSTRGTIVRDRYGLRGAATAIDAAAIACARR